MGCGCGECGLLSLFARFAWGCDVEPDGVWCVAWFVQFGVCDCGRGVHRVGYLLE